MTQAPADEVRADESAAHRQRLTVLRADCARCSGLCCVALAFGRSADFPVDKAAGEPCVNLQPDFRCGIHPVLRERGFGGCTGFDCLGAGQRVTQQTFGGRTWVDSPRDRELVFAVFQVVRSLHELLWHLTEAAAAPAARSLRPRALALHAEVEALAAGGGDDVLAADVGALRARVRDVLGAASELVRADARQGRPPSSAGRRARPGADLAGAALAAADLRGADLRGAVLLAADLRGADLRGCDLLGADLRDAQLAGADLSAALFATQFQIGAARGDGATVLPVSLLRPDHWSAGPDAR